MFLFLTCIIVDYTKIHNNKFSSTYVDKFTYGDRTMAVYKRKAFSVKNITKHRWLLLGDRYIVLTDTGSNGGVGHLVLAVVREYFYYWSG